MELRQLKYFVAAADSLNFSRAAESLYISQPTLSQQIAELENELGTPLFVRTKRSVLLTPAGGALLEKAKDLLHRSEQIVHSVQKAQNELVIPGEVCIGYEVNLLDNEPVFYALSHASMALRERYPAMRIFYRQVSFDDREKAVKRGDVDLLVTTQADPEFDSSMNVFPLTEDEFQLVYCSRQPAEDHLDTVRKVLQERPAFIQKRQHYGMAHVMKLFEELGVTPHIIFMDSMETTKLLIASGDGCIVVPRGFQNQFHYDMVHFLSIDVPSNQLFTCIVWNKDCINPAVQLVIDAVKEQFASEQPEP